MVSKSASPSGVPDAIALRDSINLLKNAMYGRAAERGRIHSARAVAICLWQIAVNK
ncbi:hypothetical protein [uncultured Helicobacter sp.]|uniref:hypothetical protein n=1 Tax=uncultured Helicobacter sp. TaxID=175537 RepID=UPI0037516FA6